MSNNNKDFKDEVSFAVESGLMSGGVVQTIVTELIEKVENNGFNNNGAESLSEGVVDKVVNEVIEEVENSMPSYLSAAGSYMWSHYKETMIGVGSGALFSLKVMSYIGVLKSPYTVACGAILGGVVGHYHGNVETQVVVDEL